MSSESKTLSEAQVQDYKQVWILFSHLPEPELLELLNAIPHDKEELGICHQMMVKGKPVARFIVQMSKYMADEVQKYKEDVAGVRLYELSDFEYVNDDHERQL